MFLGLFLDLNLTPSPRIKDNCRTFFEIFYLFPFVPFLLSRSKATSLASTYNHKPFSLFVLVATIIISAGCFRMEKLFVDTFGQRFATIQLLENVKTIFRPWVQFLGPIIYFHRAHCPGSNFLFSLQISQLLENGIWNVFLLKKIEQKLLAKIPYMAS